MHWSKSRLSSRDDRWLPGPSSSPVTTLRAVALVVAGVCWASTAAADVLSLPTTWLAPTPMPLGLLAADVSGDGKADLIGYGSEVAVARSTGTSFEAPTRWLSNGCGPGARVCQAADVNGDGKADLIGYVWGREPAPGWANVYVSLSTGASFLEPVLWNDGFCIEEQICRTGDVTGDGKADLVAYTPKTGLVWVSPSTGSSFGPNAVRLNYLCITGEGCFLGDLEGDGKDDLVVFKPRAPGQQKGNVLVSSSTGSAFGPVRYGHGYFCIDSEGCYVADMDGDHRDDIVVAKYKPTRGFEILVSLSNGSQYINASPMRWLDVDTTAYQPLLADVTGDGKADVLFYRSGEGDGRVAVQVSTVDASGRATANPPKVEQPVRVSTLNVFNCTPDRRDLYLWLVDPTGTLDLVASAESAYDDWGQCPGEGVEPTDVNITSAGQHRLIAVDPGGLACGVNDPNILGCQSQVIDFAGDPGGQAWTVLIPVPATPSGLRPSTVDLVNVQAYEPVLGPDPDPRTSAIFEPRPVLESLSRGAEETITQGAQHALPVERPRPSLIIQSP